ncbi:MAG TPA: BrnT family toxin [Terriglobia bacterium]|nr:BrnT family toxin [Terriglobia bacterium]
MKISGLIWLDDIAQKLIHKHHVEEEEVEEVLANAKRFFFVERGHRAKENVYLALGQTEAGRYLAVFCVYTRGRRALILSAREMTGSERKRYERK